MAGITMNPAQLLRRVAAIRAGTPAVQTVVTQATVEAVAAEARRRVHVRSGRTRDSSQVLRVDVKTARVTAGYGAVFEEYGTRYRPPHPFMGPAIVAVAPQATEHARATIRTLFAGSA